MRARAFVIDFVVTLSAINDYRAALGLSALLPSPADGGIHNRFRTSPDGVLCRLYFASGVMSVMSKVIDQFGSARWSPLERLTNGHPDSTGTFVVDAAAATAIGVGKLIDMAIDDLGTDDDLDVVAGEGVVGTVAVLDLGVL